MIRDPIHNYIYVTELEEEIINTPFFQRLRLIKQTPGASWVYPSANHTRFEHSLGVMHLSGKLAEKLLYKDELWREEKSFEEKEKIIQKVRLTGLLHDIGHGPFSHVFEEYLNNVNAKINHENISEIIIDNKIKPIIIDKAKKSEKWNNDDIKEIIEWLNGSKYGIGSIITESINTDTLDYLVRDAYNTGTIEYGLVDINRILEYVTFIRLSNNEMKNLIDIGTIALREDPARIKFENMVLSIDEKAIISLESFFISRLEMYKAVYYHRTVRAIECGIVKSMETIKDKVPGLKFFINLSDPKELLSPSEFNAPKTNLDDFLCLNDHLLIGKFLDNNCEEFMSILSRKHVRTALEKPEQVTENEFAEYARHLERRKYIEEELSSRLSKEGYEVNIILDVPFPLLTVKVGKIYINYKEDGVNKLSTISNYGKLSQNLAAPVLKIMIEKGMLRMIEQRVFANIEDDEVLRRVGEIARDMLGGGGISPPHI